MSIFGFHVFLSGVASKIPDLVSGVVACDQANVTVSDLESPSKDSNSDFNTVKQFRWIYSMQIITVIDKQTLKIDLAIDQI